MTHFSSPLRTFAQEEPVALAWRDSAPRSRCKPLALASSLALLSYTLLLLCRVSAGWQVPTRLSNAAHAALAMAGPCWGRDGGSVEPASWLCRCRLPPWLSMCHRILGTVAFSLGPPRFPHLCFSPPCPRKPLALLAGCLPGSAAWILKPFSSPSPFLKLSSLTLLPPVLLFPTPFSVLHLCRVFFFLSFL